MGGKGNNVARALARLGRQARPVTFLGGPIGSQCEALLRQDDGLDPLVVRTESPTRVILTVRTESSAEQTAFFDPDPGSAAGEASALLERVEQALDRGERGRDDAVRVEPGSGDPRPLQRLDRAGDCAGIPGVSRHLRAGLRARSGVSGRRPSSSTGARRPPTSARPASPIDDVAGLLQEWHRHGVALRRRHRRAESRAGSCCAASGIEPFLRKSRPSIRSARATRSWQGWSTAGSSGLEPEPLFRHAIACAVANALVWDAGAIDPAEVARHREQVAIEPEPRSVSV